MKPCVYWQHNLFMHFKSWSVLLSVHVLPLRSWAVRGTGYRLYRKHEHFQVGPLHVEWFNRDTRYQ